MMGIVGHFSPNPDILQERVIKETFDNCRYLRNP
jgi:hypothetical protein